MDIVTNVRIAEDSLAFVLLLIALTSLYASSLNMKGIKVRFIPLSLAFGLMPLVLWKGLGMFRRIFVDKARHADLYNQMHDIGEAFESISGIVIALSVIYILFRLQRLVNERRARA